MRKNRGQGDLIDAIINAVAGPGPDATEVPLYHAICECMMVTTGKPFTGEVNQRCQHCNHIIRTYKITGDTMTMVTGTMAHISALEPYEVTPGNGPCKL